MERIKAEMEGGEQKMGKGGLIVEFSIENIQVVKRRAARQEDQRSVRITICISCLVADMVFVSRDLANRRKRADLNRWPKSKKRRPRE